MDMTYYISVSENNVTVDKLGKNSSFKLEVYFALKDQIYYGMYCLAKGSSIKSLLFQRKPRNIIT